MARIVKDELDRWFEYGINLSTKTIYIGSEVYDDEGGESGVDHALAARVIKGLHILDQVKKDLPLTVILNNPGGDYYHGMAIYDFIKLCESEVIVKCFGQAMSMGSIILQAGDKRYVSKNCKFMIHYGYTASSYNHPKINENWTEEYKNVHKFMEELYLEKIREKHPTFTTAKIKKMLDFDTILDATRTVGLGLADGILGEE